MLSQRYRAGLANAFEAGGDVNAVAHEIAVALLDHVAEVNAHSNLDTRLRGEASVALGEAALHFHRRSHGFDHAAELDHRPVAGALDEPPVVDGDRRVDEVAAQSPQPRERALLVSASETAVADDVRDQDRRKFPGSRHGAPSEDAQNSTNVCGDGSRLYLTLNQG